MAWPRQAQLHHGDKTLSAAQDLGVVSMLLQHCHGFRKCLGPKIFESWRYHGPPLSTSKYQIASINKTRYSGSDSLISLAAMACKAFAHLAL
jgi:hypothetical protein